MPSYRPETKGRAAAAQQAAEWTRSSCGALGIEGNPRYLYAAFFFDLLAQVARRMAEDPPRGDFQKSTRARPRFATPQYLEARDPADRTLLEAAEAADRTEIHLSAHLRAFERMQGAQKAERDAEARQRGEEAVVHARSSSSALRELAEQIQTVARSPRQAQPAERQGRPQLSEVRDEALTVLFRGGLRIRDLQRVLNGTRLEDAVVAPSRFEEASAIFRDFASEMEAWTPPPDPEMTL